MSSSNSPHLGEAGRLLRDSITAMQDHVLKQAFGSPKKVSVARGARVGLAAPAGTAAITRTTFSQ